jgi:hypothetical protein
MKSIRTLTALRAGAYLPHLPPLRQAPARLAEVYGSARGIALARLLAGRGQVNGQTVNDRPPSPRGGRGQPGPGSPFGSLNRRERFTEWPWLTLNGSAAPQPT